MDTENKHAFLEGAQLMVLAAYTWFGTWGSLLAGLENARDQTLGNHQGKCSTHHTISPLPQE